MFKMQVVVDCTNPARLAAFWAEALGYIVQPPPPGYSSWQQFAQRIGIPPEQYNARSAVVDPEQTQPRLLFQKVPEPKAVKNRVHLDIDAAPDTPYGSEERKTQLRARAKELTALGASLLGEVDEPAGWCLVLADPEGNEFCLH